MHTNYWVNSFSVVLAVLFIGIAFPAQAQAPESEYGLLWEITHPEQERPSYLFGTMHVLDENIFDLPDSVFLGIEACDGFATEVAFDEAMNEVVGWFIEQADEIEGKRRSSALESKLKRLLGEPKKGADPLSLFQNLGEDYVAGEDQETFLDAWLYRIARDQGKVVGGVEDLETQMVLLLDNQNVFSGGTGRVDEDFLKAAYIKGDLKAIQAYLESSEVSDEFRDQVLVKRNYGMAHVSDSLIKIRPTFVAVGAGHLPGEEGVIKLMEKQGYTLRRVGATNTGMSEQYKDLPFKPRWQVFEDANMGLRVDVPAKPFPVNVMDLTDMQFGMDLPGGFFYAFYRLQMPMYLGPSERTSMITEIVSAMGNEISERNPVEVGGFEGEELFAGAEDYDFRVRVLFDEGSMLFMLVGISEKTVRSEAADRFMESVKTFVPPSLFSREWKQQDFDTGRFSASFPGKATFEYDPEYVAQTGDGFRDGAGNEIEFRSYVFDIEDNYHNQYLAVRITDLAANSYDLPDSSWAYEIASEFADLSEEDLEVSSVVRNGLLGWEAEGEADGYSMRFRQINRGFRSYLLMLSSLEEDSLQGRVDQFYDSFSFLPLSAPELNFNLQTEEFTVKIPGPPMVEEGGWAYLFMEGATDMNTWTARDSVSATGFAIETHSLSPFLRTDHPDSLIMAYQGTFDDEYQVMKNEFRREGMALVADRVLNVENGRAFIHQRHYLDGNGIKEFSIRMPGEIKDRSFVDQFFASIELKGSGSVDSLSAGKIDAIFEALRSSDENTLNDAAFGLYDYTPAPGEEKKFKEWFLGNPEADQRAIGAIGQLIFAQDNPENDEFIYQHFDRILDPMFQASILEMMFRSDRKLARDHASELFNRHMPVTQDNEHINSLVEAIIYSDSLGFFEPEHLKPLAETGYYYHMLVENLFFPLAFRDESWEPDDMKKAFAQVVDLGQNALENGKYDPSDEDWENAFSLLLDCLNYLSWGEKETAYANWLLRERWPELQVMAAVELDEHGQDVPKEILEELAGNRDYGIALLRHLDGNFNREAISKKYFKQKTAALQEMAYYIHSQPDFEQLELEDLELVGKEKLNWRGDASVLYAFKVKLESESQYMVGFAGPFPQDKNAVWQEPELTGLTYRRYDPKILEGLTERWIRSEGDI